MDNSIFEKFNEMMDIDGLKQDIESASTKTGDFVEVPHGDYEVKITKLELGATGENAKTPNAPMAKVWFTILTGGYKNQLIFMNQMLTSGFGIHNMNKFLQSLETGYDITFEDFRQYAELMENIFRDIDNQAEYQLAYGQNSKGYNTFNIVQRFEN